MKHNPGLNITEYPCIISQVHVVASITGQCDCACGNVLIQESVQSYTKLSMQSYSVTPHLVKYPLNSEYATELPQTLVAWLHVTDRCNLRCAYCYLPHTQAEMSLDTGKAAIEATMRSALRHGYREVKFKYAGGEPLLRFPLVKELHGYARKLAEQHDLDLDGVVLSNGTLLTQAMVREMRDLGLRLMVSVDHFQTPGVSENSGSLVQRIYPDGRDTAADALRGVELALEGGLTPEITITVSGRNVAQLPELLAYVLAQELPFSLNFYRENTCSVCHEDLQLDEGQFIESMLAAYKVIESNLPKRSLLTSLADMANFTAPHLRRCSVGHSYLVVDPFGRVAKCQMQMDKPVTNIYTADPLADLRVDTEGIQNLVVDEKEECRECQWKYWCAGGCPLETYRATRRYDVKSPHCNIYKALYPEVLRLEGLRLLKYAEERERE
ncbi:radical SAM domain protein [Candidatus Vecturithrix granuli]|uniref:Radical SAM domain protein n=1 Tax=Vecturithrix granuli TaxID=1499967 RepID=A0A081BYA8_VECG1|nr:radical SAM domain protein [Candidatus Vecturithrix granuli]